MTVIRTFETHPRRRIEIRHAAAMPSIMLPRT
jgi:hypothetical protein